MMKKVMMILLFFWILLFDSQAKKEKDTLHTNQSKFFTISNLEVSNNGRWSAVKKRYETNSDTLLIFDRYTPDLPRTELVKMNQQFSFLSDNTIVASGNGKAMWLDPVSLKQTEYSDIRQAGALPIKNQYFIWRKNGELTVYTSKSKSCSSIQYVDKIMTDKEKQLYVICKKKDKNELLDISGCQTIPLYSTDFEIKRSELMPSGNQIVLTETQQGTSNVRLTFIDTHSKKIIQHNLGVIKELDYVKLTEIQNGKAYLIDLQKKNTPEKNALVDIWYGNDSNLKAKKYGSKEYHQYFLMDIKKQELTPIKTDRFPVFASSNNPDYLLAFDPQKDYNYSTRFPLLNLYVYDIVHHSYLEIFDQAMEIVISSDGQHLVGLDEKSGMWILFDLESNEKSIVNKVNLEKPAFDENGFFIYFESTDGLHRYDIKRQRLTSFEITRDKEVSILGSNNYKLNDLFNIKVSSINSDKSFLIKLLDKNYKSSYLMCNGKEFNEGIIPTYNNIKEVKLDKNLNIGYSIEENYNRPPKVFFTVFKNSKKQVVYEGNTKDQAALDIRQEIIHYKNSKGISLKGTLYYPIDFKAVQKYPLIVHIYQIQSKDSNVYTYPKDDGAGFNWRNLVEKGYFVYCPDVIFDSRGTGLSALDCVNSSLDALNGHSVIDSKKIGLTGHSMGGYETNFIATHSTRFATYISSSGHSDIVRAYFSYSYDSYLPLLWQFENGQYKMNQSFSENKKLYFDNNPIHYVDRISAPILLWTGMKDENVRWDHTMEFYLGLKRSNKDVIALFYPTQEHILEKGSKEIKDLNRRTLEWWDYFLKDQKEVDWIDQQIKKRLSLF